MHREPSGVARFRDGTYRWSKPLLSYGEEISDMTTKGARKRKATTGRVVVEAPPEVAEDVLRDEKPLDVDVEKHLKWLETGKGEPWPAKRRARRG